MSNFSDMLQTLPALAGYALMLLLADAAARVELDASSITSTPPIVTEGKDVYVGGWPKPEYLPRWLAV